jgi:branched-chain amino acid transport system permease protein
MTRQDVFILVVTALIMLGLFLFFKLTKTGLAIRATAQNEDSAKLMGVKVGMIFAFAWGVGTALSAFAALLAAPRAQIHPNMMLNLQIQGLTAGVLGGFTSLPGTVIGGLMLGIIQQLVGVYISEEMKMAIALAIILVLLLIKPQGILGKRSTERV